MSKFEKLCESIDQEYNQLDESFGKAVKNFVTHATGKGIGDEILKVLDKFYSKYFFVKSKKDPDMMVKKEKGFSVGLKVDKSDANTKLKIQIIISKKGKLTKDAMIAKASWTYDEFVKNIQLVLVKYNAQVTDVDNESFETDDDGDDGGDNKKSDKDRPSLPGNVGDALLKKLKDNGVTDENTINLTFSGFNKMYDLDNDSKKILEFLLK